MIVVEIIRGGIEHNMNIIKGESVTVTGTVYQDYANRVKANITGATIKLSIRENERGSADILLKSGSVLSIQNATVTISLTAAETKALPNNARVYEITAELGGGVIYRSGVVKLSIQPNVNSLI